MMKKNILLFALFLLCNNQYSFGENLTISGKNYVYSPSAQAWQMIRYGDVNTNLYTGTCSVSIPVYTYKDEDFEIPITLNYSYNGLQPNRPSGTIGLGWNMTCGGVITREIRGVADEYSTNANGIKGFYFSHKYKATDFRADPTPAFFPGTSFGDWFNNGTSPNSLLEAGLSVNQTFYWLLNSDPISKYETEPDIFRFNFLGYRGAFIFGYDNKIHVFDTNVPFGNITIEVIDATFARNSGEDDSKSEIVIKTGDGYRYTFGGNASTVDSSYTNHEVNMEDPESYAYEPNEMMIPPTAWHLSKIEAPNGKIVVFDYERKRAIEASCIMTTGHSSVDGNDPGLNGTSISINENVNSYTYAAILNAMIINGACKVSFDYTEKEKREGVGIFGVEHPIDIYRESYGSWRYVMPRLRRITVTDIINAQNHKTLKICDLHQTYAEGNAKMFLKKVELSGDGQYSMNYISEDNEFPNLDTYAIDFWGYWNGRATRQTFIPKCSYNNSSYENLNEETVIGDSRDAVSSKAEYGALRDITYPTGGYSEFQYEPHDYNGVVERSPFQYPCLSQTEKKIAGGIRIHKITNYDGLQLSTREFIYTPGLNSSASSGNLLSMPRYRVFFCINYCMLWQGYFRLELPGFNFRSMDATHIEYSDVIEKLNNNSYILYGFTNYKTDPDQYNPGGEACEEIISNQIIFMPSEYLHRLIDLPTVSNHIARGKLTSKTIYDTYKRMVESDRYYYTKFTSGEVVCYHYGVDLFRPYYSDADIYTVGKHVHTKKTDDGILFSSENITQRNTMGRIQYVETTAPDKDSKRTYHFYAGDELPELQALDVHAAKVAEITSIVYKDKREYLTGATLYDYDLIKATDKPIAVRVAQLSQPLLRSYQGWQVQLDRFPELLNMNYDTLQLKYNNALRLIEVKKPDGLVTSYIWGKNHLHPIACIENASVDQIGNSSTLMLALLNNCDETSLPQAARSCLNSLPNSLVTYYSFIPYIGLSELEDPSGRKVFYNYDLFGRLSEIRDSDRNLVKQYNYNINN